MDLQFCVLFYNFDYMLPLILDLVKHVWSENFLCLVIYQLDITNNWKTRKTINFFLKILIDCGLHFTRIDQWFKILAVHIFVPSTKCLHLLLSKIDNKIPHFW